MNSPMLVDGSLVATINDDKVMNWEAISHAALVAKPPEPKVKAIEWHLYQQTFVHS